MYAHILVFMVCSLVLTSWWQWSVLAYS